MTQPMTHQDVDLPGDPKERTAVRPQRDDSAIHAG
jgi:hypothetical protein